MSEPARVLEKGKTISTISTTAVIEKKPQLISQKAKEMQRPEKSFIPSSVLFKKVKKEEKEEISSKYRFSYYF